MDFPYGRPWLLDGAVGTNLLREGLTPSDCPEQFILDHPDKIVTLQSAYLGAGADTLYAPTFGANSERLSRFGLFERAEEINRRLVELTKGISGEKPVGGNISPAGIKIGPEEEHTFSELMKVYAEQAAFLKTAGVDYFAIETMSSLTDIRAAVLACRKQQLPILACVTVDEDGLTASGTSALACLVVLQELGVSAFGLNCFLSPAQMAPIFEDLASFAKIPLIAKPAASMPALQDSPGFSLSPKEFAAEFIPLFERGVTIAGGCCGTTPEHLAALRKAMDSFDFDAVRPAHHSRDLVLTSVHEVFCYDLDMLEFSPTLHPAGDMTDEFMEIEDDSYDIISVEVETPDEAVSFAENDHMADLPVSFLSSDELALKTALLLYSGRAMVDSRSELDREVLEKIAYKYGAVVY